VFPVRYELNLYIVFRRKSVFKGLMSSPRHESAILLLNVGNALCLYRHEVHTKFRENRLTTEKV
jgi:hypothetical protein